MTEAESRDSNPRKEEGSNLEAVKLLRPWRRELLSLWKDAVEEAERERGGKVEPKRDPRMEKVD